MPRSEPAELSLFISEVEARVHCPLPDAMAALSELWAGCRVPMVAPTRRVRIEVGPLEGDRACSILLDDQLVAVAVTVVFCSVMTFVIIKAIDLVLGLRVEAATEETGLDIAVHGETAYVPWSGAPVSSGGSISNATALQNPSVDTTRSTMSAT